MEYLVLNTDNCYITTDFDELNFVGPILVCGNGLLLWINDKYYKSWDKDKKILNNYKKENKHNVWAFRKNEEIPSNTEILIVNPYNIPFIEKIPESVKVFLSYIDIYNFRLKINFPIELKYLCLIGKLDTIFINKIKIPFGCKLIMF